MQHRPPGIEVKDRGSLKALGSSDVPTILGLSKYQTPFEVWGRLTGVLPQQQINEAMTWGNRLEPIVAQAWSEETGIPVEKNNLVYTHKDFPFLVCTPDYFTPETVLEIKTTSAHLKHQWAENSVADYAHAQVLQQMGVLGLHMVYVAALIGGNELQKREVTFSEEVYAMIIDRLKSFWNLVETNTPPMLEAQDNDLLKIMFPQDTGEIILLGEREEKLLAQIEEAKQNVKHWEEKQKKAEAEIKSVLKEASEGQGQKYRVTWKAQTSKRIDSSALKKELPDIAERFEKESTSRVLRINEVRGEDGEEQ